MSPGLLSLKQKYFTIPNASLVGHIILTTASLLTTTLTVLYSSNFATVGSLVGRNYEISVLKLIWNEPLPVHITAEWLSCLKTARKNAAEFEKNS